LNGVRAITLPSVPESAREHLAATKLLNVLFTTLLDDIADEWHDESMFRLALRVSVGGRPVEDCPPHRRAYMELVHDVWNEMWARAATCPRYAEIEPFLRFDYGRIIASLEYALLLNQPATRRMSVSNLVEYAVHGSHNLTMVFMAMLDIAASPDFDAAELGAVRAAAWEAQLMARLGDTMMTWRREVEQGDRSSGAIAFGLEQGVVTVDDLMSRSGRELRDAIGESGFVEHFQAEWLEHRRRLARCLDGVRSIDGAAMLRNADALLELHLAFDGSI
jgi:hypothetical protein